MPAFSAGRIGQVTVQIYVHGTRDVAGQESLATVVRGAELGAAIQDARRVENVGQFGDGDDCGVSLHMDYGTSTPDRYTQGSAKGIRLPESAHSR